VKDEGVKYLADAIKANSTLRVIDLKSNNIGDEGAKYRADAIKVNSMLMHIDLKSNKIGDAGAKCMADVNKRNSILQQIELAENLIQDGLVSQISKLLKENTLRMVNIYRKLICAFNRVHKYLIRLGFEKMILQFVYYPIIGVSFDVQNFVN
jgi:Ran GTPase-activating protein (RanGAP) involved in mRNA processing and transport